MSCSAMPFVWLLRCGRGGSWSIVDARVGGGGGAVPSCVGDLENLTQGKSEWRYDLGYLQKLVEKGHGVPGAVQSEEC
jgi:hypothetical protein